MAVQVPSLPTVLLRSLLAALLTMSTSMASSQLATRLEPPAARYGRVRPVSGITSVTPPTMVKIWNAIENARPEASSLPKPSAMCMAATNAVAMMTK